ncbi:MAG: hypothetical protein OEV49_05480 [candidate division Zixibacteria bacterium]|nr:hypothetical protein [candidate division Zixibacteria bacterium]MDH3938144.1 hypothetical protein [candidate division Zixibacteria bacterium]MDH4033049.1 hypothetical protein [candidate division Zixibacteria bacterium]
MAHVSTVGEAIRRTNYRDLVQSAAHAFCWMCCYVGKCSNGSDHLFKISDNLSDIVALKFPGECGHCIKSPCRCSPEEMDEDEDKDAKYPQLLERKKNNSYKDRSIDNWLFDFWKIYSGQIHLQTLESVGFHLLEEAGEEAKAVRNLIQFRGILEANITGVDEAYLKHISSIEGLVTEYSTTMSELKERYDKPRTKDAMKDIDLTSNDPLLIRSRIVKAKMDFVVELADTFSWLCAVQLKLFEILTHEKIDDSVVTEFHIEEVLKDRYESSTVEQPMKCYACEHESCECLFYPAIELVAEASLEAAAEESNKP